MGKGKSQPDLGENVFASMFGDFPSAVVPEVKPNVVDGARLNEERPKPKASTVPVFLPSQHYPDSHLYNEYQAVLRRDFRSERISNSEIERLLPSEGLKQAFRENILTYDLYYAVREIISQCPASNARVLTSEKNGKLINGQYADVNVELRTACKQVTIELRKRKMSRVFASQLLKDKGLDDDKYGAMLSINRSRAYISRKTVAEFLGVINDHIPIPEKKSRTVVVDRNSIQEKKNASQDNQVAYKKLKPLAVMFRNVSGVQLSRTLVSMDDISVVMPASLREQFNAFVDAGGMKRGGELQMTKELLDFTHLTYMALPSWQDVAHAKQAEGIKVSEGVIRPLMSFNTARSQLRNFTTSDDVAKKAAVKEALLRKGFDGADIDLLMKYDLDKNSKTVISVSRILVANILCELGCKAT